MTDEEIKKISENVAEICWNKIIVSANKRIDNWLEMQYNRLHPEKLLKREEFLKLDENKFYNYKTKKQIQGMKAVLACKEHCKQFGNFPKLCRYYATEAQFYSMQRKVRTSEKNKGVKYNVKTGSGFVSGVLYNICQTEPINDEDYISPITRKQANSRMLKDKSKRLKLFAENNFTCQHCKKVFDYKDLEIDHIIPISMGGQTTKANLQVLCKWCNNKKSNNI